MKMYKLLFGLLLVPLNVSAQEKNSLSDNEIKIEFSYDNTTFPTSWLSKEINAIAKPLDSSEFERSKRIVLKALSKYPKDLLKKNLAKIYILKEMAFYGQPYGGTNSTAIIYLCNNGVQNGYTDFWIEQNFHSEISSIFFRNYSYMFDKKKWTSYNTSDIEYGISGVDAIKNGKASLTFDMELNEKGFLNLYATSNIEEDFNSFAENLFLSREGFWEIVNNNKRIEKKMKQIVDFYFKIDKTFTQEYFEKRSKE